MRLEIHARCVARWAVSALVVALLVAMTAPAAWALAVRQAVGGVYIDADGFVRNVILTDINALREARAKGLEKVNEDLMAPNEMRKVSLARLERALADQVATGKPLSDEFRYLAGLQSIKYVLVYPEQRDLVLVGYGEGWMIDHQGFVVGQNTHKPVMLLDDLVVALRAARMSRDGANIACSIDPTEAGLAKLRQHAATLRDISQVDKKQIEDLLGPQTVMVQGVPGASHFGRVLVTADYKMKRIGMKLEYDKQPVVPGLVSYIDLVTASGRGMQNMTPRWWLVPHYEPLLADPQGLAWELRGGSVRCMTEETFFNADGTKKQTGKTSTAGQRWADMMTSNYDKLAAKEPIFAQLRNCMDLAIVAALIVKHDLATKAECSLFSYEDPKSLLTESYEVPRSVQSQVSINQKGSNFIISASGGVEIRAGQFVNQVERSPSLDAVLSSTKLPERKPWWWN